MCTRTYIPIKVESEGHENLQSLSAQPPSPPRKRESREGPGEGHSHAPTSNPPEPPKLPKSTGNYRKLPALAFFPARWIPSKSPETRPPTVIPAPHRHSRESGNPGMGRTWGIPAPAEPPKLPKSTGNYRKLPALAFFPARWIPSKSPETRHPQSPPPPSPSFPRKRESRDGPGRGAFPRPNIQPTRTTQTTEKYRKLPEITGSSVFSGTMDPFEKSGNPPTHRHSRPPPSFPRKRESRDGSGDGHPFYSTATHPN